MDNIVNKEKTSKNWRNAPKIFIVLIILVGLTYFGYWCGKQSIVAPINQTSEQSKVEDVPKLATDDIYNLHTPNISSTTEKIKVAFVGDEGNTTETKKALKMIRDEKAEVFVELGDFEYQDNPELWLKNLDDYLGKYFPVIAVAGNHEEKVWDSYTKIVENKLNQLPKGMCESDAKKDIGLAYNCLVGGMHIVLATPDINIPASIVKNPTEYIRTVFKKELSSKVFMQEPGADGLEDNPANMPLKKDGKDPWRVCAWHKSNSLMQLGDKTDKITWSTFEECRRFGAYIFVGHDHVYARSKTVFDFPGMIVATSSDDVVVVKPGTTGLSIVGLGGMSIRPRVRQGDSWWASTYTIEKLQLENKRATNTAGVTFCTFDKNADTVPCYFKTVDGVVRDKFVMQR